MAEVSPVAANVRETSNTQTQRVQYGETVTEGQALYLKSDSKYWLADNSTTTLAAVKGVAMTPNVADGYGSMATAGDIELGATLAIGTIYTLGSTSGAIHPEADLLTTEILTVIGYGKTAALLTLDINATGIAHA